MLEILRHPKLPTYLLISACILLVGFFAAYFLHPPSTSVPFNFAGTPALTMTSYEIFQTVLIKNLIATFLLISVGILNIGLIAYIGSSVGINLSEPITTIPEKILNASSRIYTIAAILVNGYMIGKTAFMLNYDPIIIFATIFPHGYIELTMLIFIGSCSFILIDEIQTTGLNVYTLITKHNNPKVRYILKNYLFYPYILLIVPTVLIGAIIESTFSLWNLRLAIGV